MAKDENQINSFLSGNHAPVLDELDVHDLKIEGEIPNDLNGIYMRNGPNPAFPPISYTYPFDGDGMIHAVTIADGKAHYRNRFVETKGLLAERRAGKAIYGGIMKPIMPNPKLIGPDGDPGPFKDGAFIHIIRHANRYLAMHEGANAYEVNQQLETLGEWCPGTKQPIPVVPHTRLDPKTGELWLINYDFDPHLTLYCVDKTGQLQQQTPIDKPQCTMMHDFVLTENYVIFFDCPVVIDPKNLMTGKDVISWQPELGTRIGVMHRQTQAITWHTTDPFFVFHFANAYEKDNDIIIDYVRHPYLEFIDTKGENPPSLLYRTTVNLTTKAIKHSQLDDRDIEFPRIKEDRDSIAHRFIYTPTNTFDNNKPFNAIIKYDVDSSTSTTHDFGKTAEVGEAVFAPKANSKTEDDGYLMLFVYDTTTQNSDFVILDAQQLSSPPLARIKMPRRVPHGLHGSWMPK